MERIFFTYLKLALTLLVFLVVSGQKTFGQTTWTEDAASFGLDLGGNKDGGHGWCDFDLDGDFDVAINRSVNPSGFFYRNNGDGTFTDITASHAPAISGAIRERCFIWGDLNNDGYPDMVRNTSFGGIQVLLQHPATNIFGDGLGGTVAQIYDASNIADGVNTEGAGILDYDGDGDLDIIFDNHNFGIDLIENDGTGHFTHVTAKYVGYDFADESTWPQGLAQDAIDGDYGSTTDFDNDGWVDFVVRKRGEVDFFRNVGGTFSGAIEIDDANNSNKGAVNFSDFDNDGDFDLFWTENGDNQIFENVNGTWTPLGAITGIATSYSDNIDGLACGDVDNDGDIDIFLAGDDNGYLYINQLNDPVFGANTGNAMSFVKASYGFYGDGDDADSIDDDDLSGTGGADGEGATFVDVDNDGDLDLYVNINGGSNRLYINNLPTPYTDNYIFVDIKEDRLIANMPAGVSRDALGATLMLTDCDGNIISGIREINGGNGHGTQDVARIHFGVPGGPADYYILQAAFPNIMGHDRLEINVEIRPSDYAYHLYTIVPSDFSNNPPIAYNDNILYCEGGSQIFDPLADNGNGADMDPDGDTIGTISISQPTNGSAVLNDDGTITFNPNYGFSGIDSLYYKISDNPVCAASGGGDLGVVYFNVSAISQSLTCPNDVNVNTDIDDCVATGVNIGIPTTSLSCGTETLSNDAPSSFPIGNTTVTWTQNVEIIPDFNTYLAGCENAFPGPINSTGTGINLGNNNTIIGTTANTLITPALSSSLTTCDGGACSASGSAASSINFTADLGSGISGSYTVPSFTTFNVNSDREMVNFTTLDNDTLNLNADLSFHCTSNFTINNFSGINVYSDVVISANSFVFGDELTINIFSGSLTLISVGDIDFGNDFNLTSINTENFVVLSGNDINTGQNFNGAGLLYANNTIDIPNLANWTGSITADFVSVNDNGNFTYDPNAPSNFPCNLTSPILTILNNGGASSFNTNYNENSLDAIINFDGADPIFTEGSGLTWFLTGDDAAEFTIDPNTGILNFISPPDFENPTDLGADNIYKVTVNLFNGTDTESQTVYITVTDENNNYLTCEQEITVTDNIAPIAVCQNVTIQLNEVGSANLGVGLVNNGSSDNCGIASMTLSQTSFDCSHLGSNTVTLTVTDDSGNTDTCTATVTVEDDEDPKARCQNITIQLDASGNASITSSDFDDGSTDNCSIASMSLSQSSFDCSDIGNNSVTLTVTDSSGNTDTCNKNVTVEDSIDPVAICQNVTIQLDASGDATISASDVNNGSTDNCGIDSFDLSETSFDCNDVGANVVTLTVEDESGNTSTCTATITVEDNIDPVATCENVTIQLDDSGNASISVNDVNDGSSDNCGIASMALSQTAFDCSDIGANTVTLTVTDDNGNVSTCSSTVTVEDDEDPDANCQNITIQLDASGNASTTAAAIDDGSTDNCGIASIVLSQTTFDCDDEGNNNVTLTVTDVNGNTDSCNATVTVEDNVAPIANCQDITVQLDAFGNASITAGDVDAGSSDACGIASLALDNTNFDCSNIGANTVTLTVTDNNGNTSTCSATVTVQDNVDPTALCQNVTVQLDASGNGSVTAAAVNNGSSDACGIASLALDNTNFDCSNIGANTVTLTVTDNNGNTSTCSATVTVQDNVDPTALCQNVTVQLDTSGNGSVTAAAVSNGSSDACGIASLALDNTTFDCTNIGTNTVTLTVTDNNGNTSTCSATITVQDNVDPTALCQNVTVQLDASGNASITAGDIDNGSNDACGIASLVLDNTNFDCSNVGANTVTLTVTDNNGNVSTCTATVTVEDNVNPTALCQNITIALDASGNASISTGDIDNGSNDACGIASLTLDNTIFDCSNVGANTVTLTVTDNNGNISTCTATVTVEDNVNPTALCQNITVALDATGNASIATGDIDNGSSDACGIASLALDVTTFDCTNVGANTVTLTVTDNNGNVSTCTSTVTVEDNILPNAICQDITVQLDASGNASITAGDIDNGSNVACGISSMSLDITAFDCTDVGANTVTLTVTDNNGNTSTCSATVTIEDNVAPTALCQNVTVQLDASGNGSITTGDIDNGSNDACGIASLALDNTNFDCSNVGANTVTLTVTDNNGNTSTCSATVTVEDNVAPIALCQDTTVALDAFGNASVSTGDIDNGSNDACGIASLALDVTTFDCSNVGANTVTLTVTDNNGNTSTCSATVTIVDNVAPQANCQDITITLDALGNASITVADINNGTFDNCGISTVTVSETDFDCSNVGSNLITLTATDIYGNSSTCNSIVTIAYCPTNDIECPSDITVDTDPNLCEVDSTSFDLGTPIFTSNYGLNTITNDAPSVFPLGTTNVLWTLNTENAPFFETILSPCSSSFVGPVNSLGSGIVLGNGTSITGTDGSTLNTNSLSIDSGTCDGSPCMANGELATPLVITTDLGSGSDGVINASNGSTIDINSDLELTSFTIGNNSTLNFNTDLTLQCTGSFTMGSNGEINIYGDIIIIANSIIIDDWIPVNIIGGSLIFISNTDITLGNLFQINTDNASTFTMIASDDFIIGNDFIGEGLIYAGGDLEIGNDIELNGAITGNSVNIGNDSDISYDTTIAESFLCGLTTASLIIANSNGAASFALNYPENSIEDIIDYDGADPDFSEGGGLTWTISGTDADDFTIDSDFGIINFLNTPNYEDPTDSDLNNIYTISVNLSNGTTTVSQTLTVTVIDLENNFQSCVQQVTVEDNEDPVANCQNITVQLDASGNASITAAMINNSSTDNCSIDNLSIDLSTFTSVGTYNVTLTVTDASGNTDSCVATVTVEDNIDPVAICTDFTVSLDGSGNAVVTGIQIDNGSTDNGTIDSYSVSPNTFTSVGTYTVTLTVTDEGGNTSTCDATVTVNDDQAPVANCTDFTVALDASGSATITGIQIDNGSTDNGTITSYSVSPDTFTSVGTYTVTLTVTDEDGNSSTCDATVTVEDNIEPVAICTDFTVALDATGNAVVTALNIDNGSTDNGTIASYSVSPDTFTSVGTYTVTLTVTDEGGNTSTCDATVTVEDNIDPVANCTDFTVALDGSGNAVVTGINIDNGSTDNGTIASYSVSPDTFTSVGTYTVTLTVTDEGGNISTCDATVTVEDNIDPVANCTNFTVALDASGNAVVTGIEIDNGSTDNGTIASYSVSPNTFTSVGTYTVTLTVTDEGGNTSTCDATVTVEDNIDPVAICTDFTVSLDGFGNAVVTGIQIDNGSTDNGTIASYSVSPNTFTSVGTYTVTLTVTDEGGNTSTCDATVTVTDDQDPVANCTDFTIALDALGNAVITGIEINNGSTDNGTIASYSVSPDTFTAVGTYTVTLTVTDEGGNSSTCDATVTVTDNEDPVANCTDFTVALDAFGNAVVTGIEIDNGSTDNGTIASYSVSPDTFTSVGTYTVTLTVTDEGGNTSTCDATVTVIDDQDPVANCTDFTIALDALGNAVITGIEIDNGSTDNGTIASYSVSPDTFTSVGTYTVTLTVTDEGGNTSTCDAEVTVTDDEDPVANCTDFTVALDASGNAVITGIEIDNGSTDNGTIASYSVSPDTFTSVGTYTVTLTVTDEDGNTSTCDATVTVEDNIDPVAICSDFTIALDGLGNAVITGINVDGGSTDNGTIASYSVSPDTFTSVGTYTVTLTVTDEGGNTSTCDATVTVEDTIDPVAICSDFTIALDGLGNAVITGINVDGGSTDNGTIASYSVSPDTFTSVGTYTVTLTVTDEGGNTSTCDAEVTVTDDEDPVANCTDFTVALDASGTAVITGIEIDNGSTDNGTIASYSVSPDTFTSVGTYTVTLTVTDEDGNTSTCDATITVEDNIDPVAICSDFTIALDGSGNAVITGINVDGGSTDNGTIASYSVSPDTFTAVGTYTVTLTVTDEGGNTSTCDAEVTVTDDEDPVANCTDFTVALDASGTAVITGIEIDNGSTDNGTIASYSVSPDTFTSVGTYTVTLTVTDEGGNTSTCDAEVTVTDDEDPVANCTDFTVALDATGTAVITGIEIDNGSTDNGTIASYSVSPDTFTAVGTYTVTLTVTDEGGNMSTCDAIVTVVDTIDPVANCTDFTVSLDGSGNAVISGIEIDNGSTDNGTIDSYSVSPDTFTSVGTYTVTLTVTDEGGNTSTCDATVTVEDNNAPVVSCIDITVELDASGNAIITGMDIDGGSTDNGTIISYTASPDTFDCDDIGTQTVLLTVTDDGGNSSTCTATVTIEDNIKPTAICQDITVELDASGNIVIDPSMIDNGSYDNCNFSLSLDNNSFDCTNIGANTITLIATDYSGNMDNCQATITIIDTTAPTALCQNVTVQLDASGNGSITATDIDNGSNDACGIASLALDNSNFDCSNVGANTVTLTVTDNNGNTSTCSATVTVEDNVAPAITCPPTVTIGNDLGLCSATGVDLGTPTTDDNCGVFSTTNDAPATFNLGATTVTWTVTDVNGNSTTCEQTVIVEDTEAPTVLNNPGDITIECDAPVPSPVITFEDNCDTSLDVVLVITTEDDGCTEIIHRTYTATDDAGNVTVDVVNVIITDTTPPTLIGVPSDDTMECGDPVPDAFVIAIDNCDTNMDVTLVVTTEYFDCGHALVRTWSAQDDCGNIAEISQTVTFIDITPPTLSETPADETVNYDAVPDAPIITAIDICDGNVDVVFEEVITSGCPYTITRTWTAADACNNTASHTQVITVIDNIPPTAICQDLIISLDSSGNISISALDIDNGSNDNCSIASMTLNTTEFDCANVGNNTVILTVTDDAGNFSTCSALVTIIDDTAPIANCQDITVQLDATGNAIITATDVDAGSSDACGIASISVTPDSFDNTNLGDNTVTLTVTDVNGNVTDCTSTVTVTDTTPPTALCQDLSIELDVFGNASIDASDIDNGSFDNSIIVDYSINITEFDCANVGTNSVVLTVTDDTGLSSSCTATVTVVDNTSPIANCQNLTVQLDALGNVTITADEIDNGSTDACGIASLALDITSFGCDNVGDNTVILTVTDSNGNSTTCSSIVTVENNIAPNAICQDITVQLDASGNAIITTADVDNGSNANCDFTLTINNDTFDCSMVGENSVILTVTDSNGIESTCTSIVTIEDTVAPIANCQNITVQLDATGNATIEASNVDAGSSDACGIATMTVSPDSFDNSNLGDNTVTLTVTDVNGNVSDCTSTVTITDTTPPTALCQDLIIQLDADGNASITASDVDNGSFDNSVIVDYSINISSFDCTNVGTNPVILTVTDDTGLTNSCTSIVTVEDNIAPIALCQDFTAQLDALGNVIITTNDIDNGSNDACGIASLALDNTNFDCTNVGANTVTLTVTDNNGNVSTCTSTVTVEDNVNPTAICQDFTVALDASGNASITTGDIDNGSNDACGIASLVLDNTTFDCSNVGANTVTLTVTDNNGIVSTCTSTVTVEDNILPNAICQDITVQLDASGNASITAGDIDNGSNVACGISSLVLDITDFDCSMVGDNTVTLTVTDNNGNTSTCSSTVTIQDSVAPIAICQDVTVQLDASGNATITTVDIDNGSNDACGIASLALDNTNFDCSNVGANTVTLTVTDNNGNTSTCSATVSVLDNVAPTALCQDLFVALDEDGNTFITAADVDAGSIDACGIATMTVSPNTFNSSNLGENEVTLTVTDVNGNVSECTSTVTVLDTTPPTAICQDITIALDEFGNASIEALDIDNGSFDNSVIVDYSININSFDCSNVGTNTVTLTVTDDTGLTGSCNATVTVEDNTNPEAICQDITIYLDELGNVTLSAAEVDNGSNDACGIATLTLDNTIFDCSNVGANTVILTVTDNNGNNSTCSTTVNVVDDINPIVTCNDNISTTSDEGLCSALVTIETPSASDNCEILSVVNDYNNSDNASDSYPVGSTLVIWTITDVNGNETLCNQNIEVLDNELPVITCNENISQTTDEGLCEAFVNIETPVAFDNCTILSITNDYNGSDNASDIYPEGVTIVTWTAIDVNGNSTACEQQITINDNEAPSIICPEDIEISTDEDACEAFVSVNSPIVSDNCGIEEFYNDINGLADATAIYPEGETIITWTVVDIHGNESTCTQTILVIDTEAPTFECPEDITQDADEDNCEAQVTLDTPIANDNCGILSIVNNYNGTDNASDVYPVGSTTIVWTITDIHDNVSICTQTIEIVDSELPTITCPGDISLFATEGNCETLVEVDMAIANDNCSVQSISNDYNGTDDASGIYPVGITIVTWTVTDLYGNVSTCEQSIEVIDDQAPVITCNENISVIADADVCSALLEIPAPFAEDNCEIATITNNISETENANGEYAVGVTTIIWTATDVNGNSTTCEQLVEVIDDQLPTIVCLEDIIVGNDEDQCDAYVEIALPEVSDNCSIEEFYNDFTLAEDASGVYPVGTTTVTYTVNDSNGNTTTCEFTVTVEDTQDPVLFCPEDIELTNDPGMCGAIVEYSIPEYFDNCGEATITLIDGLESGMLFPIGTTTLLYVITDESGNSSSCSFSVIVADTEAPVIECPEDITSIDPEVYYEVPNYSDNCSATIELIEGLPSGSEFEHGYTIITYLVTDLAGNSVECSFTILVNMPPVGEDDEVEFMEEDELIEIDILENDWDPDGDDIYVSDAWSENGVIEVVDNILIYSPLEEFCGTDTITYIVCDIFNQCDTAIVLVDIECFIDLIIPEGFSPDGDGINDTFEILGLEDYPGNSIAIFNRWGHLVYDSEDYQSDWDGKAYHGTMISSDSILPKGTYFYILYLNAAKTESVKGFVYLNY